MRERVLILLLLITHTGGRESSTDDVDPKNVKTVYGAFNRSFYTRPNVRGLYVLHTTTAKTVLLKTGETLMSTHPPLTRARCRSSRSTCDCCEQ